MALAGDANWSPSLPALQRCGLAVNLTAGRGNYFHHQNLGPVIGDNHPSRRVCWAQAQTVRPLRLVHGVSLWFSPSSPVGGLDGLGVFDLAY